MNEINELEQQRESLMKRVEEINWRILSMENRPKQSAAQDIPATAMGLSGYGVADRLRSAREFNHEVVTYHQPDQEGIQRISRIRDAAENFLNVIDEACPASRDKEEAKRLVRVAMMTANASIVLKGMV